MTEFSPSAVLEGLLRSARNSPDRIAAIYKDREWTYERLLAASLSAGRIMADAGVKAGDRVAFLARNSDSYLIGWLATQAIGAIHVPVNFMLGAGEVRYIIRHSGAALFFVADEYREVAAKAAADTGVRLVDIESLRADVRPVELAVAPSSVGARPSQLAYTSGTESAPKGALLTDVGLVHQYMSCINVGEYEGGDVVLNALPLFHCAQLHCFITPNLFLSATNVILDKADPGEIIETVERFGVTSFFAPPTVWIGILNHPGFDPKRLRSLRKGYYGASIMPVEVLQSIRKALPWLRLWNYYGQTEIGPLAAALRPEEIEARPASAGRPVLFVETRPVDDDMNDVAVGEVGEIVHRSPQLLREYFNDPERTAEAFRGGWFHSGDLGVMDEQGYFRIVDRKKDMIKSGGENVSSREVEEVIYGHPAVAEVAVVGLPDPKWIEAVTAVVVLRQGLTATGEDIIAWTAQSLAPFKRPKQVHFVQALPKNPSGKILKRDLRISLAR